ncbi:putative ribonuclease H-like domain-containing protein [Tanacetum coccineum]
MLPLHPHRPRISVEDVAEIEEQRTLTDAEQVSKDDLERMITQEIAAKAIDDTTRQAFEEEKKRAAHATSINKLNTGRPSVSTSNSPLVSTANTPYASAASTPTGANTSGSSFVYLGGQIPIDAYTLPIPITTLRVHKDHPKGQILGDLKSAVQTRGNIQKASSIQQALKVWILVDLPFGKKAIGTKWVFRNKRDERSIVVKNKARLVAQGF